MFETLLRFFKKGEPAIDEGEYEMLSLKLSLMETANSILVEEVDRLSQENAELKRALDNIVKADQEAMQTLLEEFDIMALQAMEPVGEA